MALVEHILLVDLGNTRIHVILESKMALLSKFVLALIWVILTAIKVKNKLGNSLKLKCLLVTLFDRH
jgi:hypothetical protein